jgi:hypothetical protein
MLDLLSAMIESSHIAIPLTKSSGKIRKKKNLPGWKEYVEPFRSDAMFWHSVWLSLGRSNTGHLYRVMCWTRNKFHYAVRKLKKMRNQFKAEQLLEASEKGDIDLMAAMKEMKGKKNTGQTMPDCVEGETEHHEILEKFKEVYVQLYNSAGTAEAMHEIKNKLKNLISGDNSLPEINKITSKVVKEACSRLKSGKSDVSGSFTSEVLLHGPPELFHHLAALFRSFLVHGDVTEQLLC